tara:strand:- start:35 stop:268 length:234 start_codon:yes stop_codon:yes gene_type:complete
MFEEIEAEIEKLKNGKVVNDHCVNDALHHLKQAKIALDARETNPQNYYKDAMQHARWVMKVLPLLHVLDEFPQFSSR